jgi:cytochrome P450
MGPAPLPQAACQAPASAGVNSGGNGREKRIIWTKTAFPGPSFLTYMESFAEPRLKQLVSLCHEYGDLVKLPGPIRSFLINHVETITDILQHPQEFNKKNLGYWRLAKFLGEGLLVSENEAWKKRRRLLQPIFHRQSLVESVPLIVDMTRATVRQWQATYGVSNKKFNLTQEMLNLVLSISGKMIFSEDMSANTAPIVRHVLRAHRAICRAVVLNRFLPTWNSIQFYHALGEVEKFARKLIQKRREQPSTQIDLLTLMLNAKDDATGEGLSEQTIVDEIKTFLVTGHETAGYALGWIFWQLMQYPDVLAKVMQEINNVVGNRNVTFEDLSQLTYLRRVIEETLRIYPPIWVLTRKNTNTFQIGDYKIPARSNLIICPYTLHRHPLYWPDPEKFDPDRFLPENVAKRPKLAYLPFGAGPRVCIAGTFAMIKLPLVVVTILQHVVIENKTKRTLVPNPLFSLKQKKPLWVKIKNRSTGEIYV